MFLLNWFKTLTQASAEGDLEQTTISENQDSNQSTTAESASIEQSVIESTTDSDIPGESTDITDECIGYTPSFTSESDEQQHHHTLPPQPNQPKLKFPKRTFGKQKRSFSDTWYQSYPWLHYVPENDTVLCFYCAPAVQRKLPLGGYVETSFTETGFSN